MFKSRKWARGRICCTRGYLYLEKIPIRAAFADWKKVVKAVSLLMPLLSSPHFLPFFASSFPLFLHFFYPPPLLPFLLSCSSSPSSTPFSLSSPFLSSLLSPFYHLPSCNLSHSTAPPHPAPPHSSSSFLLNLISPPLLPHA